MRIALLFIFFGIYSLTVSAQSVFKNPHTDIVEKVLNEHHTITSSLLEKSNTSATAVSAPSYWLNNKEQSFFKVDVNHPSVLWEWGWIQDFDNQADADNSYQIMVKQLSNSIINFHETKRSAVLHIQSTNTQNNQQVYLELLPLVEKVNVVVELVYDNKWQLVLRVVQLKNKNQFVMNDLKR